MGRDSSTERRKGTIIGQVRGLGSAHQGAHHWYLMQVTSAASLLTCAYLVFSLLLLPDFSYGTVRAWIGEPVPALAMALLIVGVFRHTHLGLQTLIQDYVHTPGNKFAVMLLLDLIVFAGAAFGLLSLLRLVLGSAA